MTGTWDKIDADVRRNYCTNGYNTRGGLYADYNKKLNRIQRITQSHIEVLESGKDAHDERVYLRNRKIKEE
jgi:hypothetical protein